MRAGWAGLEAMWAPTMERVAAMSAGTVDVSVDGEWSFAQTLRHRVFATDAWLGSAILGKPDAYHPIGVPFSGWREQAAGVVELDATPSYQEVLQFRAERVGMVRDFLATLTDERLGEQRDCIVDAERHHLGDVGGSSHGPGWPRRRKASLSTVGGHTTQRE